jgi:ERF superfamily
MTKIYQSEFIADLSLALAKAQAGITNAKKEVNNTFYKSKYADLPAVLDAARPHLCANELSVVQITDIGENGQITLITQLNHSSGQWIRSWYPVNPVKNDPQGIGSAITYARRYAYSAMVGVASSEDDDDGNAASGNYVKASVKDVYGTSSDMKKRFKEIKDAILNCGSESELTAVKSKYKADFLSLKAIDPTFYEQLIVCGQERGKAIAMIESQKGEFGWNTEDPIEEPASYAANDLTEK